MMDIIRHNKIVIIILSLMIGFVGWYTLSRDPAADDLLVTEDFTSAASEAERDLVATLLELRSVSLDNTLFEDPAFRSLVDFGIEIVPEPVGRNNPFAPLGRFSTSTSRISDIGEEQ